MSVTASQKKNYLPVCSKILNIVFDTRCWIYITKWHTCVIFCRLLALIAFLLCYVVFLFSVIMSTLAFMQDMKTPYSKEQIITSYTGFFLLRHPSRSLSCVRPTVVCLWRSKRPSLTPFQMTAPHKGEQIIHVENDDIMTRSKYIPSSVRNKILYYWQLNALDDILQTLLHVKSTQEKKSRHSCASQRHSRRTTSTFECPDSQHDFEPVTHAVQEETTPYVEFLQHLVGQSGVLKWRIHSHDLDTIAMNDIDLDTGCFVKNHFAHVFHTGSSETTNITHTCTCRMYSTTQQMEGRGQTCCHVRFFTEEIEPQYDALWSHDILLPAQTPIQKKILDALQEPNVSVVRLDSDRRFHRFSVLTPDMSSCTVGILQGNYVSCQSGRCRATKGHSRKIIKIYLIHQTVSIFKQCMPMRNYGAISAAANTTLTMTTLTCTTTSQLIQHKTFLSLCLQQR